MTKLYKLSSEQLSQQKHYDFGLRAVKSVLVMAGNLRRKQGGQLLEDQRPRRGRGGIPFSPFSPTAGGGAGAGMDGEGFSPTPSGGGSGGSSDVSLAVSSAEDAILIKAMRDANVPKFLAEDLPLFHAIVGDLFPGIVLPYRADEKLRKSVLDEVKRNGLQVVDR